MRFDQPATTNPIDQGRIVGRATPRIDGPLKTTGTAPYAYEHHDVTPAPAVGYVVGAGIAKGRVAAMDLTAARQAPGVIAIVTARNAGKLAKGSKNTAKLLGGPQVDHYHQALAVVVAETFEQARAAAALIAIRYEAALGRFSLAEQKPHAPLAKGDGMGGQAHTRVGNFDAAFAKAPVQMDATYTSPDQAHAIM